MISLLLGKALLPWLTDTSSSLLLQASLVRFGIQKICAQSGKGREGGGGGGWKERRCGCSWHPSNTPDLKKEGFTVGQNDQPYKYQMIQLHLQLLYHPIRDQTIPV